MGPYPELISRRGPQMQAGDPYPEFICKRGHDIQIKLRAVVTTAPDFDTAW